MLLQTLERQERKNSSHKDQLRREQRYLGRRLEQLGGSYAAALAMNHQPMSKRRSVSECSTSTVSSTSSVSSSHSVSSISESGESVRPLFFSVVDVAVVVVVVASRGNQGNSLAVSGNLKSRHISHLPPSSNL